MRTRRLLCIFAAVVFLDCAGAATRERDNQADAADAELQTVDVPTDNRPSDAKLFDTATIDSSPVPELDLRTDTGPEWTLVSGVEPYCVDWGAEGGHPVVVTTYIGLESVNFACDSFAPSAKTQPVDLGKEVLINVPVLGGKGGACCETVGFLFDHMDMADFDGELYFRIYGDHSCCRDVSDNPRRACASIRVYLRAPKMGYMSTLKYFAYHFDYSTYPSPTDPACFDWLGQWAEEAE